MAIHQQDNFLYASLPIYRSLGELRNPFVCYEDNNQWMLKSGIENPYFNFLLIKKLQNSVFEKAFKFFDPLPFECTFARDDLLLTKKCKEQGLVFGENTTRMSLDLGNFHCNAPENLNITIKQVQDDADMRLWINTTALGFRLSRSYIRNFFYPIFFSQHKNFRFSFCFLDNVPSVASVLFLNSPYSTIFSLATRPQFRQQGLASYLLQKELLDAQNKGILNCVVHATSQGKILYQKLGFETKEGLTTFVFVPSKEGTSLL